MVKVPIYVTGDKTVNRVRTRALLGLGLALQTAAAAAWMQWYTQDASYAPVPRMWFYQNIPEVPTFGPGHPWQGHYLAPLHGWGGPQFWQYQSVPLGTTTLWSSTMRTGGLYVQQNETPTGYVIHAYTGRPGAPAVDISAQGGFLTIRSHSMADAGGGGVPMQMQRDGWTAQWISLPGDANVAAMRIQRGDGVVGIFIPRGL